MNKNITFRHMEHSGAMENYIHEQLAKLEKFLEHEPTPVVIDLVLTADKRRSLSEGELKLKTPHYDLFTKTEAPDMYEVIDKIIDVMYRMVREKKKERVDKRIVVKRQ